MLFSCFPFFFIYFFFFKQKTAYEMRISDWSSDVCSSDLVIQPLTSFRTSIPSLAKHTDHELSRFVFRTWETSLPTRSRRPLAASDPSVQHFRPDGPNLHGAYRLCVCLKLSVTVWAFVNSPMRHKHRQKDRKSVV